MTTPGATKIYAGNEFVSQISTKIYVESAARCEWLPQETIVFEGAQAVQQTQIDLDEAACFVGWDVACLGRPAAGEHFTRGLFCNRFTVTRAGIPLLSERLRVDGTQPMLDQAWGLRRHPAFGTLCVAVPGEQWVEALREHIESANTPDVFVVGTELDGISVFRAMGSRTEAVKRVLGALWNDCRTRMGTDGNHWPRIWAS
jgi:urease accessory protein